MTINDILEKFKKSEENNLQLYFITRYLKDEYKKRSKVLNKYLFKVYQVEVDDSIRNHLYELSLEQLGYLNKKQFEMTEYDVISDDSDHIFTYSMINKAFSFADVVNNQLNKEVPLMSSIEEISQDGHELWAYCVGFNDLESNDWIYTFRKIQSGKVAVDEKDGVKGLKYFRALFDTKNQKLKLLQGETINLDKQIDCIYYNDTFYIVKKNNFEQIVGLQDEYKEEAQKVLEKLQKTNQLEGLEHIEEQIKNNPSIHKKLVRISKIGNIDSLDVKTIRKMQSVCKKHGNTLNIENGKLKIENEKDIDIVLKMLADYYKTGEVSGKNYGTFAGKIVETLS